VTRLPRGRGAISAEIDLAGLRSARAAFPSLSHRVL
jgi:hypothetical protein